MGPVEYELALAKHYRSIGFTVELTPTSGDYGIDLFATLGNRKVGIQAKMYGTGRKVNREMIMQLHGASCYFDCTSAVLATNGQVLADAQRVAAKLNIEIFHFASHVPSPVPAPSGLNAIEISKSPQISKSDPAFHSHEPDPQFDTIWLTHVMPLQGSTLRNAKGKENHLIRVDWTGIERVTSNGNPGKIPIEIFRSAIRQLLSHGSITRQEINDQYAKRASSGVFLVLQHIPLFRLSPEPPMTLTVIK